MADSRTPVALRPMLPADLPVLIDLFQASVEQLAEDDYSEAQREAWAAQADDAAFAARLSGALVLVATIGGEPAGFAALEGADKIGLLYVAPDHARQGVASVLCDAMKKLATARGAKMLMTDASDTARDFFLVRGFVPKVRNMVPVGDEWLGNTSMEFDLVAAAH